ncbi:MAG TPA: NAD(P)H-dependent glycerol-3-phosphate dehydrogenase [Chitinophagaceae bacterium]|nr:NAD(P)H-dependent glycerol-3-phosphate dehydrogenase [Chitinophagaceae bacterium]
MKFGLIGSGSWATALAKVLTDNKAPLSWCVRSKAIADHIVQRHHNPNYLSSVYFNTSQLSLTTDINETIAQADCIIIAVPSAYLAETLKDLPPGALDNKKIISAVKGILPQENILLNDYLKNRFQLSLQNYFTIMGPCHAEEVAAEKLSYLTFSGANETTVAAIADRFNTPYINTIINQDVYGVQYAAVLKNIYALGAGIAHGLEYGDNFLSVFIANCADEMAGFLQKAGIRNIEVGTHESEDTVSHNLSRQAGKKTANYAASVYLGDLLVTCYSLYSRNRTFGNMIGKGYSVKAAQLEMNMVAEGHNASRCIYEINKEVKADMPVAQAVYRILWEGLPAREAFKDIEDEMI